MAVIEDCWFQAMQDEIHEFDRLEVWELVPRPIYVMVIALKWIYKVKLDEYGDVLKNKARLVAKGYRQLDVPKQLSEWWIYKKKSLSVQPEGFVRTRLIYSRISPEEGSNTISEQNGFPAHLLQEQDEQDCTRSPVKNQLLQAFTASANCSCNLTIQQYWKTIAIMGRVYKASLKNPKKKVTPLLIPYGRFSKVIIYYLASNNNIHRRPDSAVHHTGDDYVLGNLKFVPFNRATPKKPTTTTPVKQTKPAPPPTKKLSKRKLPQKVRKGKPAFQLVDEEDEAQQESIPQREDDDPDLELAKKLSLETHQEKEKGEGEMLTWTAKA
ncbi:retrovirus-related pol polyprotein from transposon TNT 1-94 [Tanacetum coccineum]